MAAHRSLLVILVVALAACGGAGDSAESSSTRAATPAARPAATELPNTSTPSTTSTTTTTTTTVATAVGSIVVAGDSMARSLFPPVQATFENESTDVRLEWVIGVVLGDQMAAWERIFTVDRPDILVAHFMSWESAALQQDTAIDTSTPAWVATYRAEWVGPWIELATSTGSRIVWVTPPLSADPVRSAEHQEVGAVWVEAIEQHNAALSDDDPRRISVIDAVPLSAGPDGRFAAVDETVDPPERLFNADGLHWCPAGAARLSDGLIDTLASTGITTARTRTPDWKTSSWAVDPESVRASEPNFGTGFAYPPGECPDPAV